MDDLGALLVMATANAVNIQESRGALGVLNWIGDKLLLLAHLGRSNTLSRSVSNIEAHYDIGNDVYQLFLDSSMTYSCGIHLPGKCMGFAESKVWLHAAQYVKLLPLYCTKDRSFSLLLTCMEFSTPAWACCCSCKQPVYPHLHAATVHRCAEQ